MNYDLLNGGDSGETRARDAGEREVCKHKSSLSNMYMSEFYNSDHFCISHKKGLRSGHRLVHTVLALERVALGQGSGSFAES